MNLLTDNLGCGTVYRIKTAFHQILTDRKERFGMSTEKKPTATVKASFISTKTEDTKVPARKEEKKVEKKTEKKAVAVKAEEKKAVPAVKAEEKKAVPAVKAEEKKAVPAVKAEEKKAVPAVKAEKKAPAAKAEKKTPAAKAEKKAPAAKAEKKAPAAKTEKKAPAAKAAAEVVLQWNGNDYTYDRLLQSAKDVWQYDQGKNVADFKKAVIYVKPEEGKAYVVVNDTDELSFDI